MYFSRVQWNENRTFLEHTKTKFNRHYKMMNPAKITIGKVVTQGVQLNFWDLGGQEELQSLWDKYYAEAQGVIFVIDASDHERLQVAWKAFDKMLSSPAIKGVPVLVVCNKQDMEGCLTVSEIKSVFSASTKHIGSRDFTFFAVSALKGTNVCESINWMINCLKRSCSRKFEQFEHLN
ncbi:unnamed protein product [Soboliphyme baturini]|uniref:ADP-ribosylation factor-related protein 1 n=1 Tax=Soboliphyme baturini TaxID=241478 RepID=A0A183IK09_9BILA|nr:unnamed protein product [Soboliphyme baturini]